jgi:NAD(P)-dependent dehydrogenase (short-subunit alcohol dehydrogenase family)
MAAIGNNNRIKEALCDIRSSISPDIDILVTCAVHINPITTTLEVPFEGFAESITTNIIGNAYLVREFLGDPATLSPSKEKIIIDVASMAAHTIMNVVGSTYGVSKLGFTQWLAHLSEEMEDKGVKIHSMHPGAILTEAARASGHDENTVPWDDAQLPGQMAVWLASKESDFLKGRFIWANWDVEEMLGRKSEFEGNSDLLRIGLMH